MSRTEGQIKAIETAARSVCVDAGAGSGKTRVLIDRLLRLLDPRGGDVPFDRIVAITFTNKAAAEMRSRLREAAHAKPNEPGANRNFWRDLERKLDSARIDTIDAFCLKLLKENALALGLDPEFTVLTDAEQVILQDEVLTRTINALLEEAAPHAVRLAVHFGPHSLRETLDTMLKQRAQTESALAAWVGLDPAQIAAKARETAERLYSARVFTPRNRERLNAIHDDLAQWEGQCSKDDDRREVARRFGLAALKKALAATTIAEWGAAQQTLAKADLRGGSGKVWPDAGAKDSIGEAIKAARALFLELSVPIEDPAVTEQSAALVHDLIALYGAVVDAIDAEKERRQSFYFDDIMRKAVQVLEGNEALRQQVAADIDHLLIDEFQDTDPRQLVIANLLHNESNGPSLFIVGDAKQSIYRFRGAEVSVFAEAREGSHEQIRMTRNHRSVPGVLGFVNDFFSTNHALEAVEAPYVPMDIWRPETTEPRIAFLLPEFEEEKISVQAGREAEALLIADRLKQMCELEPVSVGHGDASRPAAYGDAAILMRSINHVGLYERALRDAGVPYFVVAGKGFYERQEVVDLRNLLAVIADPFDEIALAGYLRSPIAGLSDDALLSLTQSQSLAAAFATGRAPAGFAESAAWGRARALVQALRVDAERTLPEFVALALERSGYEAMLLGLPLGESRAANVRKVIELAAEFAAVEGASLRRFIAYMDEVAAREIQEGEAGLQREGANAVAIMTIHKSKGLEFPIVCLPDLGRQLRHADSTRVIVHREHGIALKPTGPNGQPAEDYLHAALSCVRKEEEDAEHARILYVAMTRAEDYLLLGAGVTNRTPSWFGLFEEAFALTSRADGDTFNGANWAAVVQRTAKFSWYAEAISAAPAKRLDLDAALRRALPIEQAAAAGRTVSVSALLNAMEGLAGIDEEEHHAPSKQTDSLVDGKLRGSMVHRLFERWDFRVPPADAVATLLREDYPMPVDAALREALVAMAAFVHESHLAEPLRDPATQRELAFVFRLTDDALVTGMFDAVLPDGTLIDWKTGRFDPKLHARYERQLQLYAAAAHALGHPSPAACLVYVDEGRIESVDISEKVIADTLSSARNALITLRTLGMAVTEDA